MYYYFLKGAFPKKKALNFIYYYFLAKSNINMNYFQNDQMKFYLYYEITKKKFF